MHVDFRIEYGVFSQEIIFFWSKCKYIEDYPCPKKWTRIKFQTFCLNKKYAMFLAHQNSYIEIEYSVKIKDKDIFLHDVPKKSPMKSLVFSS